ncbi:hypothetical protein [Corynebacterium sp.]|uniref:hypothetical protein n=1 Tax=Corynebacterium sp. TaxID=1720 RepID=UPI0026DC6A4D|nr:hypothetical protein [Corynebacterium sp.]MDO5031238.1 hypothetical protein [Corynebacterium sp.]
MRKALVAPAVAASLALVSCSSPAEEEPAFDPEAQSTQSAEPQFAMIDVMSGNVTKDRAQAPQECADPFMDLGNTYAGYYLMQMKAPLAGDVSSDFPFASLKMTKNRFDPCAELSYVVVDVGDYDEDGFVKQGQAVLFFAGTEYLDAGFDGDEVKVAPSVDDVSIEGETATVTYGDITVDYTRDGTFVEPSEEIDEVDSDVQGGTDVYLDLGKSLPGSDGGRRVGFGNARVKPWDEERADLNEVTFRVPSATGSYVCGFQSFDFVCASQDSTPFGSEADFELSGPSNQKERAAKLSMTMPFGVFPAQVGDDFFDTDAALADEKVSYVAGRLIDTRGDSVLISDSSVAIRLEEDGPRKVEVTSDLDRSGWPTNDVLRPWP